jgi:hypothetical protein
MPWETYAQTGGKSKQHLRETGQGVDDSASGHDTVGARVNTAEKPPQSIKGVESEDWVGKLLNDRVKELTEEEIYLYSLTPNVFTYDATFNKNNY